ncbi:MAG: caspase family protein [Gemmatimonadota bacterium]
MRIRHLVVLAGAALILGAIPHKAPTKWALLIGISDYANFGDEIGGDLPGAVYDARRMRDVLVGRMGFADNNVKMVLDLDATRARIEREFTDWLPSVVAEGDLVFFFFAGHGSQAWDLDGDEEDGLDETICPTDVMKGNTDTDILDDELNGWLHALPTAKENVVVFLDNCSSGTGTRAVTPFARPRNLARDVRADVERPAETAAVPAVAPERAPWLELAAARADEVAVDVEWPAADGGASTYGGAFTTAFVRNLWQAPRRASYQAVFQATVEDMKRARFAQQPQISHQAAAPIFSLPGAGDVAEAGFVPVTAVEDGTAELAGGSAAGITVGSRFRAGGAELVITSVAGERARARVEGGSVSAGDRARLVAYAYPPAELRVSVAGLAPATRAEVASALRLDQGVVLVPGARDFAHLLVRPAEDGYAILGLDGATRNLQPLMDAVAVAAALRRELAAHRLAALDNPARPFAVDFGFTGGRTEFRVGDEIGFSAHSARAGYLTIVDLGTNGQVAILYPSTRVEAGQTVSLPPRDAGYMYEAQAPAGRGIVRAIVTERPLELPFTDGSADAAPAQAAEVAVALRAALRAPAGAVPVEDWATASVVYTITPR